MVIGPWTKSTETPPTSVGKPLFATGKIGSERRAVTPKTDTARTCPGAAVIVFEGLRYPKPATVTPVWACINVEQPSARKTQQVRERVVKNKVAPPSVTDVDGVGKVGPFCYTPAATTLPADRFRFSPAASSSRNRT